MKYFQRIDSKGRLSRVQKYFTSSLFTSATLLKQAHRQVYETVISPVHIKAPSFPIFAIQ